MLYVRLTKVRIRTGPGESTEKWPTRTRGEGVNKYTNPIYKHRFKGPVVHYLTLSTAFPLKQETSQQEDDDDDDSLATFDVF